MQVHMQANCFNAFCARSECQSVDHVDAWPCLGGLNLSNKVGHDYNIRELRSTPSSIVWRWLYVCVLSYRSTVKEPMQFLRCGSSWTNRATSGFCKTCVRRCPKTNTMTSCGKQATMSLNSACIDLLLHSVRCVEPNPDVLRVRVCWSRSAIQIVTGVASNIPYIA